MEHDPGPPRTPVEQPAAEKQVHCFPTVHMRHVLDEQLKRTLLPAKGGVQFCQGPGAEASGQAMYPYSGVEHPSTLLPIQAERRSPDVDLGARVGETLSYQTRVVANSSWLGRVFS